MDRLVSLQMTPTLVEWWTVRKNVQVHRRKRLAMQMDENWHMEDNSNECKVLEFGMLNASKKYIVISKTLKRIKRSLY